MNYLDRATQIPMSILNANLNFAFGLTDIKTGNDAQSLVNLHGLNDENISLPSNLKPFSPVVIWQDQRNSTVKYTTDDGFIDTSASCGGTPGNLDAPCFTGLSGAAGSPREMNLHANPSLKLYGAVYQPRGAWVVIWSGSEESGPLQIVSGAYNVHSGATLTLLGLENPITTKSIVLVE